MWNLKCDTNEHIYETETDSHMEGRPVVAQGEGEKGLGWEAGVHRRLLLSVNHWIVFDSFVTLWTVLCQVPRPWDFSGENTGVGRHFLLQGSSWARDRICISCLSGRFFTTELPGKPRISRHKLLCMEWINNKVLLYHTGNSIQDPVMYYNWK